LPALQALALPSRHGIPFPRRVGCRATANQTPAHGSGSQALYKRLPWVRNEGLGDVPRQFPIRTFTELTGIAHVPFYVSLRNLSREIAMCDIVAQFNKSTHTEPQC
jgi:hypothetical protein